MNTMPELSVKTRNFLSHAAGSLISENQTGHDNCPKAPDQVPWTGIYRCPATREGLHQHVLRVNAQLHEQLSPEQFSEYADFDTHELVGELVLGASYLYQDSPQDSSEPDRVVCGQAGDINLVFALMERLYHHHLSGPWCTITSDDDTHEPGPIVMVIEEQFLDNPHRTAYRQAFVGTRRDLLRHLGQDLEDWAGDLEAPDISGMSLEQAVVEYNRAGKPRQAFLSRLQPNELGYLAGNLETNTEKGVYDLDKGGFVQRAASQDA